MGAGSETGAIVFNEDVISSGRISKQYLEDAIAVQKEEIARRIRLYRGGITKNATRPYLSDFP